MIKIRFSSFLVFIISGFLFAAPVFAQKKFTGIFTNGYKGAVCTFQLSADGKKIEKFTFKGYWRCSGKTELILAGPEKSIPINNGKFHGKITDPEDGGSTAFRFEIAGEINGKEATGTFRMNINALSCDTYLLQWTAKPIS